MAIYVPNGLHGKGNVLIIAEPLQAGTMMESLAPQIDGQMDEQIAKRMDKHTDMYVISNVTPTSLSQESVARLYIFNSREISLFRYMV